MSDRPVHASGWTIDTLKEHYDALRVADDRFQEERDRRTSEGATLRERALNVKEIADKEALGLSRENQNYKDEKADKARDLSLSERGGFVTKGDLELVVTRIEDSLKPLFDFVAGQKGVVQGTSLTTVKLFGYIAAGGTLAGIAFALINYIAR